MSRPERDSASVTRRFSHNGMGTTFELMVPGEEADYAQQAARAAFGELDQVERELSCFIASSDVSQVNALGVGESLRVGLPLWECLQLASRIHQETGGAFDVTVGRLLACWQAQDGSARTPSADELSLARACTGMELLYIREAAYSVGVEAEGVLIDLGGIGKGYALDRMAILLREWRIDRALIHAGQSSVFAIGSPPGEGGWRLSIRNPEQQAEVLGFVCLCDRALSGSGIALHGQHIINPRSGLPVEDKLATWATAPSAAASDALSTAFMVMSADEAANYCGQHPEVGGILLAAAADGRDLMHFGEGDKFMLNEEGDA